ncbi:hypothetical protein DFJ77DRAFT_512846 [Powellomyces hirtus]|nr:hypothetical protein DFJ77DRAFT_512846 [Powellomyces hirtus]
MSGRDKKDNEDSVGSLSRLFRALFKRRKTPLQNVEDPQIEVAVEIPQQHEQAAATTVAPTIEEEETATMPRAPKATVAAARPVVTHNYQLRSRDATIEQEKDQKDTMVPTKKPVYVTIEVMDARISVGKWNEVTVEDTTSISELKTRLISTTSTVVTKNLRLSYERRELADHMKLSSLITPLLKSPTLRVDVLPDPHTFSFLPTELLDPQWDRLLPPSASTVAQRGGNPYVRPGGWMRFGLKVTNKYQTYPKWLGPPGPRDWSDKDEWIVTYHGTACQSAASIARQGYNTSVVWSTGSLSYTNGYSQKGHYYEATTGVCYRVVVQNRLSPKYARASQGASSGIYTAPPEYIRPYAILVQRV